MTTIMIMTAMVITQEMLNAGISKLEGTPTNPTTSQPSQRLRVSCPSKVLSSPSCWALPHLQRFQKNVESRWNRIGLHIMNPKKQAMQRLKLWNMTFRHFRQQSAPWPFTLKKHEVTRRFEMQTSVSQKPNIFTTALKQPAVIEEPPAARCPGCCYHQC